MIKHKCLIYFKLKCLAEPISKWHLRWKPLWSYNGIIFCWRRNSW